MASTPHSESPKTEQIITEFFAKTLHIILESRSPSVTSRRHYSADHHRADHHRILSSSSSRDKWFNLALRDCPGELENLDLWRHSNLDPTVVDVVVLANNSACEGLDQVHERVIERWIVEYETRNKDDEDSRKLNKRGGGTSSQSVYKKSIVLLRSLYTTVRILPAYRLYRDLGSSGKIHEFSLAHRVSSFVEPFTRTEEAEMRRFVFTPVETACGRLCISVLYSPPLLSVVNVESSTTPMSPRFIPDYVGSPLTNPLKRFPSIPLTGLNSQGLPSFPKRHTWSHDPLRNFPPSMSPAPSPTFPDSHASLSKMNSNLVSSLHKSAQNPYSCNAYLANKNTDFDKHLESLSTSNHLSKALLGTESAPVSTPTANLGNVSTIPSNHDNTKALTKMRDVPSDITTHKKNTPGKDVVGNLSGAKLPSHKSLGISCSRSFGRFSFQDDFDESEFCPFALDDIDPTNTHIRTGSFDEKRHVSDLCHVGSLTVRKSQDAAVGSLVHLLKTAPPLSQDFSNLTILQPSKPAISNQNAQEPDHANLKAGMVQNSTSKIRITSSGRLMLKTTSEALEELKGYRDMKEKLLKHGYNVLRPVETGGM